MSTTDKSSSRTKLQGFIVIVTLTTLKRSDIHTLVLAPMTFLPREMGEHILDYFSIIVQQFEPERVEVIQRIGPGIDLDPPQDGRPLIMFQPFLYGIDNVV